MRGTQLFLAVMAAMLLVFGIGTAIGNRIAARAREQDRIAWARQLNLRIRVGWVLVLLFAAGFALGEAALAVLFAAASFFALREFVALTPIRASDYWALVLAFYVVIPLQYLLVGGGSFALFTVFIPVYLFLLLPVVMAIAQDTERYLDRVAKMQWGMMICVFCVSHAPAVARLSLPGYHDRGWLLLLYLLLVVFLADLLAVVASVFWGRTPLRWDPTKSREGVLAGAIGAVVVGTLLWGITPFRIWQSTLMSMAIVGASLLGSVVLTAVERSLGVRDLAIETGVPLVHGVLGRIEGLAFAAPVFFHLTLYFFAA
ncbi:MAG: phosphatidate cytidylyltransferase [Burkholderiales bacterium]|jgi:phosphatidate cytidylyltransferase|nr:phosphatidate cytidylyltransferase [Burkholderiales bacterium]